MLPPNGSTQWASTMATLIGSVGTMRATGRPRFVTIHSTPCATSRRISLSRVLAPRTPTDRVPAPGPLHRNRLLELYRRRPRVVG